MRVFFRGPCAVAWQFLVMPCAAIPASPAPNSLRLIMLTLRSQPIDQLLMMARVGLGSSKWPVPPIVGRWGNPEVMPPGLVPRNAPAVTDQFAGEPDKAGPIGQRRGKSCK